MWKSEFITHAHYVMVYFVRPFRRMCTDEINVHRPACALIKFISPRTRKREHGMSPAIVRRLDQTTFISGQTRFLNNIAVKVESIIETLMLMDS